MEIRRICEKSDAMAMSKAGVLDGFIRSNLPSEQKFTLREAKALKDATGVFAKESMAALRGGNTEVQIGDDVRVKSFGGNIFLLRKVGGLWLSCGVGKDPGEWATAETLFPEWNVIELCSQNEIDSQSRKGGLRNYLSRLYLSFDRKKEDVWYKVGDHMLWHYAGCLATDVYGGKDELSKQLELRHFICRSEEVGRLVELAESHLTEKTFGPF